MLLSAIDLVVFLSLAAQFAIAGYFLYLVYWLIELPPADFRPCRPLPDEPAATWLVQIPGLPTSRSSVERAVGRGGGRSTGRASD